MVRISRTAITATLAFLALGSVHVASAFACRPSPGPAFPGMVDIVHPLGSSTGTFDPAHITVVQAQGVEWTWLNPGSLSVTDSSGMGLFDSGSRNGGAHFLFKFQAAGTYLYHSKTGISATGSAAVSLRRSPGTGTLKTTFTIGLSCTVRSGYVEDVEIHAPGGAWRWWHYGVAATAEAFKPSNTGWYMFRSRFRRTSNDRFSNFSPNVLVHVT